MSTRSRALAGTIAVTLCGLAAACGPAVSARSASSASSATATPTPTYSWSPMSFAPDTDPSTAPPPPPATTAAAQVTIDDGTWTVGLDFLPGTYRTIDVASGDCYWEITKSGSNGADIIDNHLGGGHLTVSLKRGQDFTTQDCGTWAKVH